VMLREALAGQGTPVLGALRRDERLTWRDRHLGLVPVAEEPAEVRRSLGALADAIAAQIDLEALVAIARAAPARPTGPLALPSPGAPVRIGVAAGRAFTFTYTDTLDALEAGGAEVVPFDPLHEEALPSGLDGIVAGGGFPEVFAGELAANRPMLASVRDAVQGGLVTWAECDGRALAGVIPADATMTDRLTLGYRSATTTVPSPLGPAGTELRGHEFHYASTTPTGSALQLTSRFGSGPSGFASPSLLATFLHHHPGGDPSAVASFLEACRANEGPT
jgi:cobyrinic acid a,c-diamide synthase